MNVLDYVPCKNSHKNCSHPLKSHQKSRQMFKKKGAKTAEKILKAVLYVQFSQRFSSSINVNFECS